MSPDIELFLKLSTDKVNKNVTVVSKEELGQNYMLHISPDKMNSKPYIPRIGHRQGQSEDRTIPRITVAPTLLGCYVGYAQWFMQFFNYNPRDNDIDSYRQGLYIHEIEFDEALKPNNKLVYDASRSDEHWLVTYSEQTKQYKGKIIGKMFIRDVTVKPVSGKFNVANASFYVEVNKPEGIRFSKNFFLRKGYWLIAGIDDSDFTFWDKDKNIVIKEVSKSDYDAAKNLHAALLSLSVNQPPFAKW